MKIEFETKFNLQDIAWCMVKNRPTPGVVTDICYTFETQIWLTGTDCESIWKKIKQFFGKHEKRERILYSLTSLTQEGKFACSGEMVCVDEDKLFATKEELLKSL